MQLPKVSVIGAGQVGATTTHLLALKGLADVTLIDIVEGLAQGKALDITQSAPVEGFAGRVTGTTDFDALAGSHLVIVTAGMARKPGMSRDDLLAANANIVGPIADRIAKLAPGAIVIVVTNPLDVMVSHTLKRTGFARNRIMGMAGVLDSSRLRAFISMRLNVPPASVSAMILGSHGDLMVAVRNSITVDRKPLSQLLPAKEIDALIDRAKNGGAEIVSLLKTGSAYYAPATGAVEMAAAILRNTHATLPVCAQLSGEYALRDVCIGVPAQLGAQGIERVVEMPLSNEEQAALANAAKQVNEMVEKLSRLQTAVR